jgi:hypothetical protein
MKRSVSILSAVIASLSLIDLGAAARAVSSDRPAAIVTFPHVVVDSANGVDTFLQLANADDSNPVDLQCFLEDTNGHCSDDNSVCDQQADCAPAICVPGWQVSDFTIRLTEKQPFGWHASAGASSLPLPANSGAIPPVQENPFRGLLRCIVVDASGAPTDSNVLLGAATVERYRAGIEIDAARYNPIGLQAIPGANNGDGELVLGTEYESCPAVLTANYFFDFAIDPMTHSSEILSDLILVPCSGDFFFQQPGSRIVQFFVRNEFEQQFSTSRAIAARHDGRISLIDTSMPDRSIFSAGVAGTLTGQTRFNSFGGGIVGMAVEKHAAIGQPAGTSSSAAFNLHSQGVLSNPEVMLVGKPPICRFLPVGNCRTAGKSSLAIRDRASANGDDLTWRLRNVQSTDESDLGTPLSTTEYGLCIYDGATSALLLSADVPASPAKWRPLSNGVRYKDPGAAEGGISRIIVRTSTRDRARVLVDAEGSSLALPALPLQVPFKVQLVNSVGTCWEADYQASDVLDNSSERFKAR